MDITIYNTAGEQVGTIAVDEETDTDGALFRWCANWDPSRDTLRREGRVGFDATKKLPGETRNGQPCRDYPPILRMDDETKALVDRRWAEYGFGS